MGCYEGGGWVAGEAEDGSGDGIAVGRKRRGGRGSGGVFEDDGGEGAGFARFHGHAAEMDGAAEGTLDGRFEEVEFAHGDAARGYDDVDGAEGEAEVGFEGAGSVLGRGRVWLDDGDDGWGWLDAVEMRMDGLLTCLWRYRDPRLGSPNLG